MVTTPLALIPQTKTTATTNQSDHQSNYHQNKIWQGYPGKLAALARNQPIELLQLSDPENKETNPDQNHFYSQSSNTSTRLDLSTTITKRKSTRTSTFQSYHNNHQSLPNLGKAKFKAVK